MGKRICPYCNTREVGNRGVTCGDPECQRMNRNKNTKEWFDKDENYKLYYKQRRS